MHSCAHALMFLCSYVPMLSCSHVGPRSLTKWKPGLALSLGGGVDPAALALENSFLFDNPWNHLTYERTEPPSVNGRLVYTRRNRGRSRTRRKGPCWS